MKLREFIGVFEQSERLRIVKDGKEIYTGYKALMEHAELEAVMDAEVKRFCPVPEIRHKEWKKTGIDAAYEAGRNAGIFLFRFANDTIQHHLYLGRKGRHYDFKGNTKF
jgi:hypothetical protein